MPVQAAADDTAIHDMLLGKSPPTDQVMSQIADYAPGTIGPGYALNSPIDWRRLSPELYNKWMSHHRAADDREAISAMNKAVFLGTIQATLSHQYPVTGSQGRLAWVRLPEDDMLKSIVNTTMVTEPDLSDGSLPHAPAGGGCKIEIWNMDAVDAGFALVDQGSPSPCVLNLASAKNPGGGSTWGTYAQEESIVYRSAYYRCLNATLEGDHHQDRASVRTPTRYPWPDVCAVYSPDVLVFRQGKAEGNRFMQTPRPMSFLGVAAVKNPELVDSKLFSNDDYRLMHSKIRLIFEVARRRRHGALVLGALGCGAYNCPNTEVARIFRELLDHYSPHFQRVVFAIIDNRKRPGNHLDAFADVLGVEVSK